jgi:hypothetical protein
MDFKVKKMMVSVEYALTVDNDIFSKILDKDDEAGDFTETLSQQLMETLDGVSEVDYDGHFGPHIYIHLDPKFDYSSTWFAVYKIINDYVK